jgi:hypothetical protein
MHRTAASEGMQIETNEEGEKSVQPRTKVGAAHRTEIKWICTAVTVKSLLRGDRICLQ